MNMYLLDVYSDISGHVFITVVDLAKDAAPTQSATVPARMPYLDFRAYIDREYDARYFEYTNEFNFPFVYRTIIFTSESMNKVLEKIVANFNK